MSNRRQFFTVASAGVALASLGAPALAAMRPGLDRRRGGSLTLAEFERLQGQDFAVQFADGGSGSMRLNAVKSRVCAQPIEQFSLVLRGEAARAGQGGYCTLEHAQAGRLEVQLMRSGSDADGALYRADFSLLM